MIYVIEAANSPIAAQALYRAASRVYRLPPCNLLPYPDEVRVWQDELAKVVSKWRVVAVWYSTNGTVLLEPTTNYDRIVVRLAEGCIRKAYVAYPLGSRQAGMKIISELPDHTLDDVLVYEEDIVYSAGEWGGGRHPRNLTPRNGERRK